MIRFQSGFKTTVALALIALAGAAGSVLAQPILNTFTYQGELRSSDTLFEGPVDVRFTLWPSETGGIQIGTAMEALGLNVSGGRFTVILNSGNEFGVNAFNGERRWIEIAVRNPSAGGGYEVLSPRQELTLAPYASFAADASRVGGFTSSQLRDAGALTGTLPDARLSTNIPLRSANQTFSGSNTFTGANLFNNTNNTYLGNGAGITALNASNINAGTLADARLSSNIALRNANQTLTGANVFNNVNNTYVGNGAGITGLNASNINAGTLADARLSANVAMLSAANGFLGSNTFAGTTVFNNNVGIGVGNSSAFRLQLVGGTGSWRGGVAAGGTTRATVMGELTGVAVLGAHNGLLNAWAPLAINPTGEALGIGTGTTAPVAPVHISNAAYFPLLVESNNPAGTWFNLRNSSVGGTYWHMISTGSGNGGGAGRLLIGTGSSHSSTNGEVLTLSSTGQVGVGTILPAATFHVFNGSDASLAGGGHIISGDTAGLNIVMDNNEIMARSNGGAAPLYLNQGSGHVIVPVLEITGGSDVAEPYDVAAAAGVEPVAGMVVAIDPENVGKMRVVSGAYDRTVAGIISGANGIKPGITLTQTGTIADGDMPVASIGRVWCWCDADQGGPISAGDMLTTSDTPGHAMKVNDHARSQGATLGKAMSSLKSGKGLVLVLVSLQ